MLRGLAVVGMLLVDNRGNGAIAVQLRHAGWNGLHLADVVFPVFLLLVGVSMPFSRRADRPRAALLRVLQLGVLGWLVVTAKYGPGTAGAGVLGHIAGAYLLCWLVLRLPRRAQPVVPVAVVPLVSEPMVPVPPAAPVPIVPELPVPDEPMPPALPVPVVPLVPGLVVVFVSVPVPVVPLPLVPLA